MSEPTFGAVTGALERVVFALDRLGQWLFPLLMALIVVDVIGRRLLSLPTVAIQEAEWHVHGALFLSCLAATYLRDRHVRVEIVRERLGPRVRAGIELAGKPALRAAVHGAARVARSAADRSGLGIGRRVGSGGGPADALDHQGLPAARLRRDGPRLGRDRLTELAHPPGGAVMLWSDWLPAAMFVALFALLFSGFPVAFVLGGVALAFALLGMALDLFMAPELFNIIARIYGAVVQNYLLVAIPMFIFMGALLDKSGIGDDLLGAFSHLLRRVPGGLGLSVTLLGTILAATTGIVGASVVMLTLLAAPTMLARGYRESYTMGIIGAAGTLGILLPPSIMLVLMADLMQISAGRLFLGAIVPGLVLAALYALYSIGAAWWDPGDAVVGGSEPAATGETDETGAQGTGLIAALVPVLAIIALVLGSIVTGLASTTEAAGVGAFGAFVLVLLRGRMTRPVWNEVLESSARINGMLFMIFIGAAAFSYVFRALGGDFLVEDLLLGDDGSAWQVLGFMLLGAFLLGFFFEWIEISLILLPIYVPIIGQLDFGTHVAPSDIALWVGILFAVNLQTSFLTPPFGISLFYMRGVAPPGVRIQSIYRGVVPFVGFQLAVMAHGGALARARLVVTGSRARLTEPVPNARTRHFRAGTRRARPSRRTTHVPNRHRHRYRAAGRRALFTGDPRW